MDYNAIEQKYIDADIKGHYQFRSAEEIKKVLGVDMKKIRGINKLNPDHVNLFEKLLCIYFNGYGLKAREEIKPKSVKEEINKFKLTFTDNTYSYLYFNGTVG